MLFKLKWKNHRPLWFCRCKCHYVVRSDAICVLSVCDGSISIYILLATFTIPYHLNQDSPQSYPQSSRDRWDVPTTWCLPFGQLHLINSLTNIFIYIPLYINREPFVSHFTDTFSHTFNVWISFPMGWPKFRWNYFFISTHLLGCVWIVWVMAGYIWK